MMEASGMKDPDDVLMVISIINVDENDWTSCSTAILKSLDAREVVVLFLVIFFPSILWVVGSVVRRKTVRPESSGVLLRLG